MKPVIHTLYDEAEIAARVESLDSEVASSRQHQLLVVAVLKGIFIFAA